MSLGSWIKARLVRGLSIKEADGWCEPSRSGQIVTVETALRVSAALCAARVIAEGLAQVPLKVMRREDRAGRSVSRVASDDPRHRLLHERPNAWQTSAELREMISMHAVLTGAGRALITRGVAGDVRELLPLMPDQVVPFMHEGELRYRVRLDGGGVVELSRRDVFELRGPAWDPVSALNIVGQVREALGLSMLIEGNTADAHRRGLLPNGALSPIGANPHSEAVQKLAASIREKYGAGGEGGVVVTPGEYKFTQFASSAVDAQTIEHRRFQIEEIARAFRVSPLMLMQADKAATYASAEQFFIAHVVHTLGPWVTRWEQALALSLFDEGEAAYPHFVLDGLMRGSAADRASYYVQALGSGGQQPWMTANEVRELEDLPPLPGGDVLHPPSGQAAPDDPAENQTGGLRVVA